MPLRPINDVAERHMTPPLGVLLMAHGTPDSLDQMPEYLARVRGGRLPSPELVDEMRHNYGAIGGRSPLTDITRQQGDRLQETLGPSFQVLIGMRNWHPFIAEALQGAAAAGISHVVAIPLAPQASSLSVTKYLDAAKAALPSGMTLHATGSFYDHPLLLDAFAERVREADPQPDEEIVFTAHSLPRRVIEAGDVYASEVGATSAGVASRCGIVRYQRAYQSAGRTAEPWLGPDLSDLIRERTAQGARRFLVVPVGFVCDHTEILFDIDVQAAAVAKVCGASLRRTGSLNTSPRFIEMLASLAGRALDEQVRVE